MVTHDPRYADYADRKAQLFDGRVVDENTMIDLSQRRARA
jgi:putative ABC transport system ATP-binding protein